MKKTAILRAVIAEIEKELRSQQAAMGSARAGATDEQSRAETKWDTCGLEASYLAHGLAQQFESLATDLLNLRSFMVPVFDGQPVSDGALIEVELDRETLLYFMLPSGGGLEVQLEGRTITVITSASPIGAALLGKQQGSAFSFRKGSKGRIVSVV